MAIFEYVHLALSVPPLSLFESETKRDPDVSRTEFLREMFSTRHDFFHRGTLFVYVPAPSELLRPNLIAGFVGKQISSLEPSGPDELYALVPHKSWRAAFLVADIDPTRQTVAVERKQDVGAADKVIESIASSFVDRRRAFSWHVDVEYVSQKQAFADAARRFRGRITSLEFTFNPPNALRGFEKFKEFDKIAQTQTNAEKSQYALKNPSGGIDPTGDFVESAVDYATEGAGRVKMKEGRLTVYDSRHAKQTRSVPESYMPREGEPGHVIAASEILHPLVSTRKGEEEDD